MDTFAYMGSLRRAGTAARRPRHASAVALICVALLLVPGLCTAAISSTGGHAADAAPAHHARHAGAAAHEAPSAGHASSGSDAEHCASHDCCVSDAQHAPRKFDMATPAGPFCDLPSELPHPVGPETPGDVRAPDMPPGSPGLTSTVAPLRR